MSRFLLSGHRGFLGLHLMKALEQEHSVIGVPGDVCNSHGTVYQALDFVLHLASYASPKDFLQKPLETLRANSKGTENLLDLALEKGAVFFYPSSAQIYAEKDPSAPRSVYSEGKRYGEALVSAYEREHKLRTKIVRMFNVYGPGMRPDDGRVIPAFINLALGDKDIIILGGTQLVSFTFVDDMIDALIRFLFSDEPGPIELGNPERVSICDLAREIVWQTGSKSKVRIQYADMKSEKAVDMTGADILRWKATTGIEEGIAKTVEWFRR